MKYIRTKDGIISSLKTVRTSDIIKKADTIEELCDEFVDIYENEKPDISLLSDIIYFESYKSHIVYGAIWTDKGLIYVAKMNDEGELELL